MPALSVVFFFNDTATTEIYTLSLHDALPIYGRRIRSSRQRRWRWRQLCDGTSHWHGARRRSGHAVRRSEEHTSELQSLAYLVCRLLLEKKKIGASPSCIVSSMS